MKRTWTLRYKFYDNGQAKIVDGEYVRRMYKMHYPSLCLSERCFQLGDGGNSFILPRPTEEKYIFENLPPIGRKYVGTTRDCENITQKRLVQIADFTHDWTDIPEGFTFGIFEVRATIWNTTKKKMEPHSMLTGINSYGYIYIKESPDHLIEKTYTPTLRS